MSIDSLPVTIRRNPKPGKVKAHADVTLILANGRVFIHGFSIIQVDEKSPFVGLPSRPGTTPGKYFPIVELDGPILESVTTAILEAYERSPE